MKKFFYRFSTKAPDDEGSSNLQAPSTRETPSLKLQNNHVRVSKLGSWNFSGAWMLVLGAFSAAVFSVAPLIAQENQGPSRLPGRSAVSGVQLQTNAPVDYASDLTVVHDAQEQALQQARELLAQGENVRDRTALETAIKEMERAQAALGEAKESPEKLPAALAAEQAAYQALLKVTPREFNMTRSRRGNQSGSQSESQRRQMDQLEMPTEENRYETERQATAPPNAQQREQLQTADRLKELAQRQQDLNERLRELQNSLQAAHTDQEREEIQRQLKRLRDEERQMLAKVDELRQQLAQSPNASSQAETRQQLDQARTDMERAAQQMENDSASQALAAGTRAQQTMQNLRDDLRKQTSSQFTEQMRDLRNQARELAKQQDEIANKLDSLNNGEHQTLDNSAERQQLVQQMTKQQGALTNLLAGMRNVTEQAEATEPLLSQKLYDTLRRADQAHTDNLLEMGTQLADRGFLPQAGQAESFARTNINELRRGVEVAAESVLGSEADALRYAQKELDDLTHQVEREMAGAGTNAAARGAGGNDGGEGQSNRLARAEGQSSAGNASGNRDANGTNGIAGANDRAPGNESQTAGNNPQSRQRGGGNPANAGQNENRGQQPNESGNNGEQASAESQQNGQGGQSEAAAGNNGQRGNRSGDQQQANNNSQGQRGGTEQRQDGQNGGPQQASAGGGAGGGDRLRQFTQQLGAQNGGGDGGPITGNNYVNWSGRLRDVEQVLDPQDLRNQLATVRERVAVLRADYRERGQLPQSEVVRSQILAPMTQVRVWLQEELSRQENAASLVPLDRDPVPDAYAEVVRKYYEKLGSAQ
jgi:hypothetical protein